MRFIFIIAAVFYSIITFSQPAKLTPNHQSLVNAEWAFIEMAKDVNTRDAFLANFTDETIVFKDNLPVKASPLYESLEANDSWLKWEPVYTDIAASGDFGINTGPWEFRAKKTDEKPVAYGHFVSVWKKTRDGKWKLAIDLGISHPAPDTLPPALSTSSIKTRPINGSPGEFRAELLQTEKSFIQSLEEDLTNAYREHLSTEARIYRVGYQPFITPAGAEDAVKAHRAESYTFVEGDVAPSGDLGFVYGVAEVKNPTGQNRKAFYARIWKRENGKDWKIILDVLSYQ